MYSASWETYLRATARHLPTEPVEGPPAPPGRGGLTYDQGPHVTYENKKLSYRLENRASATYFFVAKLISIAHSCL